MTTINNAGALSISQLQARLGTTAADTEVRGTATTLYTKGKFTDITVNQEGRAQRQSDARTMIGRAVDKEFEGLPAAYAAAVKKNMASVFEGTGKVSRSDVALVAAEASRVKGVRDAYVASVADDTRSPVIGTPAFDGGKAAWRDVIAAMPEGTRPTDYFGAMERYVQLLNTGVQNLTESQVRELGALQGQMTELRTQASDIASLERATRALSAAVDGGATSAKVLPQAVALNQMGNEADREGRCLPLVALASVAEARGAHGMDGLLRRLEQETHAQHLRGARERTPYAADLGQMHGQGVLSRNSTKVTAATDGHRDVLQHLAASDSARAGKPTFYGITVPGHIMMVGATRHDGKDSFMFYDPNFGVARFDSVEKLSNYLDKYFGAELGYGKDYRMKEGSGGFEMNAVSLIQTEGVANFTYTTGSHTIRIPGMLEPA